MQRHIIAKSKCLGACLSRSSMLQNVKRDGGCLSWMVQESGVASRFHRVQGLSGIAGVDANARCEDKLGVSRVAKLASSVRGYNAVQSRGFLGVGDGVEGNSLCKTHKEKCVIGYSPEQLYAVVAAVDMYEEFLPWCQRSQIVRRFDDGSFDAELEIGFKFFVESYVSHVELIKSKRVKSTATASGLFEHLINIWEFNPGPTPGSCDLHFFVDFKFQSPLYRQVASIFFEEVVARLVGSFRDRCGQIYGPANKVLENPYGKQSS